MTIGGTVAYRVVWNENVVYYGDEAHYKPLAPIVVATLTRAEPDVEFVVPRVEPGKYPVVIYDGGEGGAHYTWDLFTVTEGRSQWRPDMLSLAIGATGLLAAVLLVVLRAVGRILRPT